MFKHQDLIEKLTIEQKLSLLADFSALGNEELSKYGPAVVKVGDMNGLNEENGRSATYPEMEALANTWNKELIEKVACSLAISAKEKKVALLSLPNASVKSSPYAEGLSEDPHLVSETIGALINAGEKVGVKTCIANPALRPVDVEASDAEVNMRAMKEYFMRPLDKLAQKQVGAVCVTEESVEGEYQKINEDWLKKIGQKLPVIYREKTAKEIVKLAREGGKLCLGGSASLLKEGYERYLKLRERFEAGEISLNEMETECRNGNALSPATIDLAVDEILDFNSACRKTFARKSQVSSLSKDLLLQSAEESTVLLKNKKVLPIGRGKRVALIGDLASVSQKGVETLKQRAESLSASNNLKYVGYARGYDIHADRSDELIKEAVALASKADVVVLALGFTGEGRARAYKNRTSKLPANQLVLVEQLAKTGVKIVALVCGESYPDMRFDERCHGVLLTSLVGTQSATAIFKILTGYTSPSGKLSTTLYNDTDEYFANLQAYKQAGRNKIGVFYGYRHYDTSALSVKYPFGYGLSYNRFTYGKIQRTPTGIRVKVKNKGRIPASEVVQLYLGKKDSAILRPKKELKAFQKVYLRGGRSQYVYFEWKDIDARIWDEKNGKWETENGIYEVYIGSSCKDVKRKASCILGKTRIAKDGEKLSSYIQTCSNIKSCGYYLDPPVKIPKEKKAEKKLRSSIRGTVTVLMLDIIYGYFHFAGWTPKHWLVYLLVLIINAIPMGLLLKRTISKKKKIKRYMEESMKTKQKEREELNIEDLAEELPYEQLFEEEFSYNYEEKEKATQTETRAERSERMQQTIPFDKEFTFELACEQFSTFCYERGVAIDPISARKFFSAMASSRLLVLKSGNDLLLSRFVVLMGEYFGKPTAVRLTTADNGEDILYDKTISSVVLSPIARVFVEKHSDEGTVRMLAVTGAKCADLKTSLAPIIRYIDQPERATQVALKIGSMSQVCEIAEECWFVLTLATGERISDIPKYLLDMSAVVELALQPGYSPKTRPVVQTQTAEEVSAIDGDGVIKKVEIRLNDDIVVSAQTEEKAETTETVVEQKPQTEEKTETSSVAEVKVVEEVIHAVKTPVKKFTYPQFKKMVENACRTAQLEEVHWKRIDRLEEFVSELGEYRIENKIWQRLEKYSAVGLASGGEEEETLDATVASHLIYGILPCVAQSKKPLEDKFSHTLEEIFGEGHVSQILKAVKDEGLGI